MTRYDVLRSVIEQEDRLCELRTQLIADLVAEGATWKDIAPFSKPSAVIMYRKEHNCSLREAYDAINNV
jgi:hypothetical protein